MLVPPSRICSKTVGSRAAFLGCCGVLEMYLGLRGNACGSERTWTLSPQNVGAGSRQVFNVNSAPPTRAHLLSSPFSRQSGDQENTDASGNVNYGMGRNSVFVFSARQAAVSATGDKTPSESLFCNVCHRSFSTNINRRRHMREKHERKRHLCTKCGKDFARNDYLANHKCRN